MKQFYYTLFYRTMVKIIVAITFDIFLKFVYVYASYKLYFFWNLYYFVLNDENDVSLSKRGITIDGKKNLLC